MSELDIIQNSEDPYTAAADWLERMTDGPLDPTARLQLQHWLDGGDGRRQLLERMIATWGDPALAEAAGGITGTAAPAGRRRAWTTGITAAAACLLCALAWVGLDGFAAHGGGNSLAYESAVAEEKSVALEDGSELLMEADTRVDVRYRHGARQVQLHRGAAYFAVARDHRRPFTVFAGEASVEALGTEFSVDRIARGIRVRVHEGTVRVRQAAMERPRILNAGQALHLDGDGRTEIRDFVPSGRGAWHTGWIDISDESLHYLIEHLSRYSQQPIILRDPALQSLRVAGRFDLRDTGATLGLLGELYPLQVSRRDGRIVISPRKY